MAQLPWSDLHLNRIRQIITDAGFDVSPLVVNQALKQDLIDWLEARNLQPTRFLGQVTNVYQEPPPQTPTKLDCRQQDGEPLLDFIKRFECALQLNQVTDDKRVALLQLNLKPEIAVRIADFTPAVRADYDQVKTQLLALHKVNKYSYLDKFTSLSKHKDESFQLFAQKLQINYLGYLGLTPNDMNTPAIRDVVHAAVLPRVLDALPRGIQLPVRTYAINHAYNEVLTHADDQACIYASTFALRNDRSDRSRPTTQPTYDRRPNDRRPTDRPPPPRRSDTTTPPNRGCFRCGKPGHIAANCPPGNA